MLWMQCVQTEIVYPGFGVLGSLEKALLDSPGYPADRLQPINHESCQSHCTCWKTRGRTKEHGQQAVRTSKQQFAAAVNLGVANSWELLILALQPSYPWLVLPKTCHIGTQSGHGKLRRAKLRRKQKGSGEII